MKTVLEFETRGPTKVWYRMVTIESGGTRHNLTTWKQGTRASIARLAKREGIELVEVPA